MTGTMASFRMPRYWEIPDVGLYLDQTVKYLNRFLAPLGLSEVTASMVSNYVKKGYIRGPEHKQYDAEQIAYLFFIAVAKSVLSMENIARLTRMQRETYAGDVAYNYFCDELENVLEVTFGLKKEAERLGVTDTEAKTMLRSTITAVANIIYLNSQFEALAAAEAEQKDGKA